MLNLDTHILVSALAGSLAPIERRSLSNDAWSISAIVLWELSKLVQLGRIELDLDNVEFLRTLSAVHVWPITLAIARASCELDFKSDPADELIAATSVIHRIPLITRDRRILASKIVPFGR
jgi:PIN domain nuclease of toxin-antitoxin system